MRLTSIVLITILLSSFVHAADAPTTRPTVPALLTNKDGTVNFVIDGVIRMAANAGWAFHVARDGERQVCAIVDVNDGTPIYLSDGSQTLIYDIVKERVVLLPHSRAYIDVLWKATDPRPLTVSVGVMIKSNPTELAKVGSTVHVDEFLAAADLRETPGGGKSKLLIAKRGEDKYEGAELSPAGENWFRFSSAKSTEKYQFAAMLAKYDQPIAEEAMRFPDLAKLREDVAIGDIDANGLKVFLSAVKSGQSLAAKIALGADDDTRKNVGTMLPPSDWARMAEADRKLGAAYRAALAKQGIVFKPADMAVLAATGGPTTLPTTRP